MNKIMVYGRLCSDVEVKDFNGRNVANFRVASQNKQKNKDSNEYGTNFYNVACWGATADVASRFLHKGNRVAVSGDLVLREYVGTDGVKHMTADINNADISLVETKSETAAQETSAPAAAPAPQFTPVETPSDLPF